MSSNIKIVLKKGTQLHIATALQGKCSHFMENFSINFSQNLSIKFCANRRSVFIVSNYSVVDKHAPKSLLKIEGHRNVDDLALILVFRKFICDLLVINICVNINLCICCSKKQDGIRCLDLIWMTNERSATFDNAYQSYSICAQRNIFWILLIQTKFGL